MQVGVNVMFEFSLLFQILQNIGSWLYAETDVYRGGIGRISK